LRQLVAVADGEPHRSDREQQLSGDERDVSHVERDAAAAEVEDERVRHVAMMRERRDEVAERAARDGAGRECEGQRRQQRERRHGGELHEREDDPAARAVMVVALAGRHDRLHQQVGVRDQHGGAGRRKEARLHPVAFGSEADALEPGSPFCRRGNLRTKSTERTHSMLVLLLVIILILALGGGIFVSKFLFLLLLLLLILFLARGRF
jgi:hypothetical protein